MNIENIVCDADNLFEASKKVIASSPKKQGTIYFKRKRLAEIKRAQEELHARTWKIRQLEPFMIYERGHRRKIIGNTAYDRMIIHSYLDFGLEPLLRKYLIYDNYASQTGKGTSLARERFVEFLNRAYQMYGQTFYVLMIDFAKFYDNVQHAKLKTAIMNKIPYDPFHEYMLDTILRSMRTDVSHMTDKEYAVCMETKYSALANMDEPKTGRLYMDKGLNIGNQGSQLFSIFYPSRIDTFLRCVMGVRLHGRYMDDTFIIHNDKAVLHGVKDCVREIASEMGIFIHETKTQIHRADKGVKWLNRIYQVDEHGCVSERIVKNTITRQRRKLKKFRAMLDDGTMNYQKIENQYRSWIGNFGKVMPDNQRQNMDALYNTLFIKDWRHT